MNLHLSIPDRLDGQKSMHGITLTLLSICHAAIWTFLPSRLCQVESVCFPCAFQALMHLRVPCMPALTTFVGDSVMFPGFAAFLSPSSCPAPTCWASASGQCWHPSRGSSGFPDSVAPWLYGFGDSSCTLYPRGGAVPRNAQVLSRQIRALEYLQRCVFLLKCRESFIGRVD